MSGHSKWSTIKRQKAVTDAKKGAIYARISQEIIISAKQGGGDPSSNFRLRQAIERARSEGVPNDNIQRALEKGSGSGASEQLEELTYEGYGPGGVAVLVKCTTDNRNRTAGDVRNSFSKFGGNLGESGCVSWMFKERGEIVIKTPETEAEEEPKRSGCHRQPAAHTTNAECEARSMAQSASGALQQMRSAQARSIARSAEKLLQTTINAGAEDIEVTDNETATIFCLPDHLESIHQALITAGYTICSCEVVMNPISLIHLTEPAVAEQLLKLMDTLENCADVQQVFANFELDEKLNQDY